MDVSKKIISSVPSGVEYNMRNVEDVVKGGCG